MARKHDEPSAPVGVGTENLTKHRSQDHEQTITAKSPGTSYHRPPASASYDPVTGRAARVGQATPDDWRQIPSAGEHTAPDNRKRGSRPGRW